MRLLSEIIARSASDPQPEGLGQNHVMANAPSAQPPAQAEPRSVAPSANEAARPAEPLFLTDAVDARADPLEASLDSASLAAQPLPVRSDTPSPSRREMAQEAMKMLKERAVSEPANPEDGRAKTRLLGFGGAGAVEEDVFATPTQSVDGGGAARFPVGWLVVTSGPGTGMSFALHEGAAQIGRGSDQAISLDFGDTAISRANHAAVAYDSELNAFYLGHGWKTNIVRLNNRPVLSTEELTMGDEIRIGETTLRFVALCGDTFTWADAQIEG